LKRPDPLTFQLDHVFSGDRTKRAKVSNELEGLRCYSILPLTADDLQLVEGASPTKDDESALNIFHNLFLLLNHTYFDQFGFNREYSMNPFRLPATKVCSPRNSTDRQ